MVVRAKQETSGREGQARLGRTGSLVFYCVDEEGLIGQVTSEASPRGDEEEGDGDPRKGAPTEVVACAKARAWCVQRMAGGLEASGRGEGRDQGGQGPAMDWALTPAGMGPGAF